MFENFIRVAAATPRVHIGNISENVSEIIEIIEAQRGKTDLLVTPELSLTGYTCADLFTNRNLINNCIEGLGKIAEHTEGIAVLVGMPLEYRGELLNCAVLLNNKKVSGIVPKTYIPNYGEFYEKRWFSGGRRDLEYINFGKFSDIPFGNNVIFNLTYNDKSVKLGVEICEDAWTPVSPGRLLALNGAEIIVNLSASNEVIGKESYRRNLVKMTSSECLCGYVYVSAGRHESTQDLVFGGHNIICENGKILGETKLFTEEVLVNDINLTKIRHDRIANKSFSDCRNTFADRKYEEIKVPVSFMKKTDLYSHVSMTPFVPNNNLLERSLSIFNMQVAGLMRRIETTRCKCIVVGVSGGLDSTLALLVSAAAVKRLNLSPKMVVGITMPGFGTTKRTKNNSTQLMKILGCDIREINIVDSVRQHFKDIGQKESDHDITYENCQARERTQILMDVSNKEGGFVIGTGDLSELALGWCTYNGDHMSMYGVNASIPKTLVRTLVDYVGHYMADNGFDGLNKVIEDIILTPVSPELLPPNPDGTIAQKTEDTVGSYILHDFYLYYTLRFGMTPEEIYDLCRVAVKNSKEYNFNDEEKKKWLNVFYTRFFRQQFKRDCMPDGVKVGTVSVSPRGDLRMPSEVEMEEYLI